jgi:hypothetical protein
MQKLLSAMNNTANQHAAITHLCSSLDTNGQRNKQNFIAPTQFASNLSEVYDLLQKQQSSGTIITTPTSKSPSSQSAQN